MAIVNSYLFFNKRILGGIFEIPKIYLEINTQKLNFLLIYDTNSIPVG